MIGYLTDENLSEDFNVDARFRPDDGIRNGVFFSYNKELFIFIMTNKYLSHLRIFNWDSCAWILFDVSPFKYLDQMTCRVASVKQLKIGRKNAPEVSHAKEKKKRKMLSLTPPQHVIKALACSQVTIEQSNISHIATASTIRADIR